MRTLNFIQWRALSLIGLMVLMTGCGSEDEPQPVAPDKNNFTVTSEDVNCSNKTVTVLAPFAGKIYRLSVEASEDISWSVTAESTTGFVTVSPQGEQTGDGTIEIIAAANPGKEEGKKATVTIKNSVVGDYMKISLEQKEKEIWLEGCEGQTEAQFQDQNSKYNVHYMKQSDNIALFWDKSLGRDPKSFQDQTKRFDPDVVLFKAEEVYCFLIDDLGFSDRTTSLSNKYKLKIWVRAENQSTAYGGGTHGGEIWLGPNHVKGGMDDRFGIFYHEMCHSFQFMVNQDDKTKGLSGPIGEMTSQYSLLRAFPNWMELEEGHIKAFLKNSHKAFLHKDNEYHSPYVLEYWGFKHGENLESKYDGKIVSRVWKEANRSQGEDAVQAYQRITGITQEQFNDEIYDAAARFVTWDLPRIEKDARPWANKHECKVQKVTGNRYQITPDYCPQNYGYNAIGLEVPASGKSINLSFIGNTGLTGYHIVNADRRGWRYGFLAVKKDGTRDYGEMGKTPSGTLSYTVPNDTKYLWLVVTGAPTKHWTRNESSYGKDDEQWPYQFTLTGTSPLQTFIK